MTDLNGSGKKKARPAKKQKARRRLANLLIQPNAQLRLAGLTMFFFLSAALAYNLSHYYYFRSYSDLMLQEIHISAKTANYIISKQKIFLILDVGLTMVLAIVGTLFFITISHRTFGPVISIKKFINKLIDGDYDGKLILRKNDELKDISNLLNRLAGKLKKLKKG